MRMPLAPQLAKFRTNLHRDAIKPEPSQQRILWVLLTHRAGRTVRENGFEWYCG